MATLWQVSVSSEAVKSLNSLCRIVGYPPFGHDNICWMEKDWPQVQCVRTIEGSQPYRKPRASLKACLCKAKRCSSRGKTVNQLDVSLSLAISIARCRAGEASSLMCLQHPHQISFIFS